VNRTLGSVGVVVLGLLVSSGGCRNGAKSPKGGDGTADIPRVQVKKPERKKVTLSVTRPGHLEAFEQTPIHPKVEGYVGDTRTVVGKDGKESKQPIADIGDRVKKGEVLAEILVPELVEEYQQELGLVQEAEAGVVQAAKLVLVAEKTEQSAKAQIAEAQAGVIKAEGTYQFAKSEHKRIKELAQGGSVTKQLVDEKLSQLKSAEASQAEATAKVDSVKAAHAEAQAKVEKARADQLATDAHLVVAKARAAKVKALLDYTQIRAPFDGIVTQRNIDPGHYVWPPKGMAKPLYVVASTDIMRAFVDVPEMEAALVYLGDAAVIQVQALKGKEFKGTVIRNSGALDPVARTLKTEIDLPNKAGLLLPGMYVMVKLTLQEPNKVLTVPVKAVVQEGNKTFCSIVEAGKVVRKEVVLGLQAGNDIEIISGLTGEEDVVRENAGSLKQGQKVEVVAENVQ
jgi:RND family efflux transporter MFP subunit